MESTPLLLSVHSWRSLGKTLSWNTKTRLKNIYKHLFPTSLLHVCTCRRLCNEPTECLHMRLLLHTQRKNVQIIINFPFEGIHHLTVLTSCMVRSAKRTTMLSSTLTIKPVSPSYRPPITFTWSPILKCFCSSCAMNSKGSYNIKR